MNSATDDSGVLGRSRFPRPSLAGRRVALDRKFRLNTEHYGGRVKLLTLTPPGEDLLPFGDEVRKIDGEDVAQVEWVYRTIWNATAQTRASRLFEAAQRHADRFVRRLGWEGELPRQVGNVRAEQKRGVWHFHYLLPFETPIEQQWSRLVQRFMDRAWRTDQRRWPDEAVRRELIFAEYRGEKPVRGFYGFGFIHGGNPAGKSREKAAKYMSRNAAGYLAWNALGSPRHYVSSRITRATGITMKALRGCNYLYVRQQLGESPLVPSWWSEDRQAEVLRVWAVVNASPAP